jgi:hypothetical protein
LLALTDGGGRDGVLVFFALFTFSLVFSMSFGSKVFISRKMLNRENIGESNGTTAEANTRTHRQTTHLYFQLLAHP